MSLFLLQWIAFGVINVIVTNTSTTKKTTIEAYGNKGLKNTPWRREFKNTDAMIAWAEKNDASIVGVRDLEY